MLEEVIEQLVDRKQVLEGRQDALTRDSLNLKKVCLKLKAELETNKLRW